MHRRLTATIAAAVTVVSLVAGAGCSSSSGSGTKSSSGSSSSKETFCTLLVAFRASNDALSSDVGSGDAATTKTAINRLVGQAQTLQQRAPKDIAPDVGTVESFLTQLRSLLAQFSFDLNKLQADPSAVERFSTLNSPDVQKALDQLRSYGDNDCAAGASTSTTVS